jgi:nicotinamidase-related amidase
MMDQERILLDIETQKDFFSRGGSCYTPAASKAASNVDKLFRWARENEVPVLSTVLRVRPGETGPLSPVPHCQEGTDGEQKISASVLPNRINLGLRNTTDLPRRIFDHHQQVIIEKRDPDIFAHSRAERLITEIAPCTFILCGAGIAKGIVRAAVGLRSRGFGIILADDAALDIDDPMTEMARLRMEAKGVIFAPTREIITVRRRRRAARFRKSVHAMETVE